MDMNHKKISSKGGKTTFEKYGPDHFAEMGRKGAESKLKKDPEYFRKLSIMAQEARKKRAIE